MTLTDCERSEWRRMADSLKDSPTGRMMRDAANCLGPMPPDQYDSVSKAYRQWLVFNGVDSGEFTIDQPPSNLPGFGFTIRRMQVDKDGTWFVRIKPYFLPGCTASGRLEFACFDANDCPESVTETCERALEQAKHAMSQFMKL